MATAAGRFSIFPPSITYAGPTTLNLTYVQRVQLQPGAKINRVAVAGLIDAGASLVAAADPVAIIETRSLTALLGAVNPTSGLALTAGGLLRYQQRDQDAAGFMTTSVHVSETFGLGYMGINSISATQDDEQGAVANCTIYMLSADGLTNPITRSTVASVAAITPAFGSEFYLGPLYYNGAQITGVKSFSIDFGLMYSTYRADGSVFPTACCITSRRPVLKVTCNKLNGDAGASVFNRALAGAFVGYFANAPDAGLRTSYASSAHGKFSASAGAWRVENIEGSGTDDATVTWVCDPTTNITYSIAATIP